MRGPLMAQGLIRERPFGFLEGYANSDDGRSVDVELETPVEGDPSAALAQMASISQTAAGPLFCGAKRIGDDCVAKELRLLGLPSYVEEIGDNFNAPKLSSLKMPLPGALTGPGLEATNGSPFRRIGDNFSAPSLASIHILDFENFTGFGRNFQTPSLVALTVSNCPRFKEFPRDFRMPSLVNLNLKGCRNFERFPPQFFDGMHDLRSIELRGTGVRFRHLPPEIRNNRGIHIDIRPADDIVLGGGAQSTHVATVHFSSSESAQRVLRDAGDFDVGHEFRDLRGYINGLPEDTVPEGLQPYIDGPLPQLRAHLASLEPNHPHKRYFMSEVSAAKRAVSGQLPHQETVDPHSDVTLATYLTGCWRLMKDPDRRWEDVTLDDGRTQFVHMLHEIQRGYNLRGEAALDDGDPRDKPICFGGAFNKVTDRMTGFLRDVQIIAATDELIQMKTDAAIKQAVHALLDEGLSLEEFTEPDEDDEVFCSPALAQRIRDDVFGELVQHLRIDGEPREDWERRTTKIAGFLDYQLTATDMSEVIHRAKGKGKASAAADE